MVTCVYKGDLSSAKCVVVDDMLGWLARWLRIIGVDVPPTAGRTDEELASTPCLLATRDRELFKRRKGPSLLLLTDDHVAWLSAVIKILGLSPFNTTRCPLCNSPLIKVDCSEAERAVGHKILSTTCWRCPTCDNYYWPGSHWRGITQTVAKALIAAVECEKLLTQGV